MFANIIEIAPAPEGLFLKTEYLEFEGEENPEYERVLLFALVKDQHDRQIVMPVTRTDFQHVVDAPNLLDQDREVAELYFLNPEDAALFKHRIPSINPAEEPPE